MYQSHLQIEMEEVIYLNNAINNILNILKQWYNNIRKKIFQIVVIVL